VRPQKKKNILQMISSHHILTFFSFRAARMTARNHHLRAVSLEKMNEFLKLDESKKQPWRSTFLRTNLLELAPLTKANSRENPIEKMKSIVSTLDQVISATEKIRVDEKAVVASILEIEAAKKQIVELVKNAQQALQNFRLGGALATLTNAPSESTSSIVEEPFEEPKAPLIQVTETISTTPKKEKKKKAAEADKDK
jgi:hypothetical protein